MFFYRGVVCAVLLFLSVPINDSVDGTQIKVVFRLPAVEPAVSVALTESENIKSQESEPIKAIKLKPLDLALPKIEMIDTGPVMDSRLVKLPDLFVVEDSDDSTVSYRAVPHFKGIEHFLQKPEIDGATLGVDIKLR